jgi:hypothetical protein
MAIYRLAAGGTYNDNYWYLYRRGVNRIYDWRPGKEKKNAGVPVVAGLP